MHTYHCLFSLEPNPTGVGNGPYLGLSATDVSTLIDQFVLPLGFIPFHFAATQTSEPLGAYLLPPGLPIEAICVDFTNGVLFAASPSPPSSRNRTKRRDGAPNGAGFDHPRDAVDIRPKGDKAAPASLL
jgi:hypothetical protein